MSANFALCTCNVEQLITVMINKRQQGGEERRVGEEEEEETRMADKTSKNQRQLLPLHLPMHMHLKI